MRDSTLTAKGQTTLPKPVRDLLGLAPGDKVRNLVPGDEVRIVRPRSVMELAGSLRHEGPALGLDGMDAAIGWRARGRGGR